MRNGKYQNHAKRGTAVRSIAVLLAVVLLIGGAVGGTLAWLTASTKEVENTFTVGNINVELKETTTDYKMVPGWTIEKDPVVTVKADSEDCWVFVKVEESSNLDSFIKYDIDPNNWTELDDVKGVYYCKATDITSDRAIKVLGYIDDKGTEDKSDDEFVNNKVLVKDTVTKQMMDALTEENYPKLTFTAYAVQLYKNNTEEFTPAEAWAKVTDSTT